MRRIMVVKDEPDTEYLFSRKQIKKRYPNINTFILTAYCYDKNCKLAKEYGASYSWLSPLGNFSIDTLKIGSYFLMAMNHKS